jgi:hypothetical protein
MAHKLKTTRLDSLAHLLLSGALLRLVLSSRRAPSSSVHLLLHGNDLQGKKGQLVSQASPDIT